MLVKQFDNQLMKSNCYIIVDDDMQFCIVVDPASEKSLNEIAYIVDSQLIVDFIILTHEHTDHTWGVNALLDKFPMAKVIASRDCKEELPKADQSYFRLYMDDADYEYYVKKVDYTVDELNWKLTWHDHDMLFFDTPGHSSASMCFSVDGMLFSGDTILQVDKMYIDKKNGSFFIWRQSVDKIISYYSNDTIVYPGHGKPFLLKDYKVF